MPKGNKRHEYNISSIIGPEQTEALRKYRAKMR